MNSFTKSSLAKYIDHTLLSPYAASADIEKLCREAIRYGFYSCCVNPCNVSLAARLLKDYDVTVSTVCGFPLGASDTDTKVYEAQKAVSEGSSEIDMVMNIGRLLEGDELYAAHDIEQVVKSVPDAVVKVIIECCYLNNAQKALASSIAVSAGAAFVKTSTGFGKGGATAEDVALIRKTIGNKGKIKAAGGIRTLESAVSLIQSGADRLGCSASVSIINSIDEK